MKVISNKNAEHYLWGASNQDTPQCDGWHLVKSTNLSVIQERMPPNTKETFHLHNQAEQFFFILSGQAVMQVEDSTFYLEQGDGVHIPAGIPHQMRNESEQDLHFTVTSTPPSHGDRETIEHG